MDGVNQSIIMRSPSEAELRTACYRPSSCPARSSPGGRLPHMKALFSGRKVNKFKAF